MAGKSFPAGAAWITGSKRVRHQQIWCKSTPAEGRKSLGQALTGKSTLVNKGGERQGNPRGTPGPDHTGPQAVETHTQQGTENQALERWDVNV